MCNVKTFLNLKDFRHCSTRKVPGEYNLSADVNANARWLTNHSLTANSDIDFLYFCIFACQIVLFTVLECSSGCVGPVQGVTSLSAGNKLWKSPCPHPLTLNRGEIGYGK